jgi:hypothetical protein
MAHSTYFVFDIVALTLAAAVAAAFLVLGYHIAQELADLSPALSGARIKQNPDVVGDTALMLCASRRAHQNDLRPHARKRHRLQTNAACRAIPLASAMVR